MPGNETLTILKGVSKKVSRQSKKEGLKREEKPSKSEGKWK